MTTYVTNNDFNGIKKSMSEEEIKEKYGRLVVMNDKEHKKYQIKLKRTK
jgi:hypothetical protein